MYPHERSLVERLKDSPFVLLGLNSDPLETAQKAKAEKNLSWRSWWDGGDTRGPIATKWGVTSWPSIFVIDAKGKMRYHGVRGEEMDIAIDTLLAEIAQEEAGK